MERNTAGQKLTVFAFDYSTGAPKTGDAANITAYVSIDDGAVTALADTSASQVDATAAAGNYTFDLTQEETNGRKLSFSGKSTTANVVIVPRVVYTTVEEAIKAKTDSLTFTVAGQADVNVQYVNDVPVTGTGATGDEWNPAP